MRFGHCIVVALLWGALAGAPAGAITSGGDQPPAKADAARDDYEAGLAAFEAGDWRTVIERMMAVIEDRPWHADAYNRMGFAWRKLGDYDRALSFYDKALELDPHHRGALEYQGEAYLELDRPDDARALLERLATECRRIGEPDCEEWQDLQAAYDAYRAASKQAATAQ